MNKKDIAEVMCVHIDVDKLSLNSAGIDAMLKQSNGSKVGSYLVYNGGDWGQSLPDQIREQIEALQVENKKLKRCLELQAILLDESKNVL